jgi:hypothetical protein
MLPWTALSAPLGLAPISLSVLGTVAAVLVLYLAASDLGKHVFFQHSRAER